MSRWEALTANMRNAAENWTCELERIKNLQWWDSVAGKVEGFPSVPSVNHIHPTGLVANFLASDCRRNHDCATRFKKISRIILRHEGGYVNRSDDKGGPTKHGITLTTWKAYAKQDLGIEPTWDSLKSMTEQQAETIYFNRYWEPKGFCDFKSDRVALMVYDWSITSGGAILQIQKLLNQKYQTGLAVDGNLGKNTVEAINSIPDQEALLQDLASIRKQYYTNLTIKNATQIVFLKGWLGRVDDCLGVDL